MRKRIAGKKLSRTTDGRKHLVRNLVTELIFRGRIVTTEAKARVARREAEKLVTKARKNTVAARRTVIASLPNNKEVIKHLFDVVAPKFKNRPGGYTRLLKIKNREGDNAPQVILEWVVSFPPYEKKKKKQTVKQKNSKAKVSKKKISKKEIKKEDK